MVDARPLSVLFSYTRLRGITMWHPLKNSGSSSASPYSEESIQDILPSTNLLLGRHYFQAIAK